MAPAGAGAPCGLKPAAQVVIGRMKDTPCAGYDATCANYKDVPRLQKGVIVMLPPVPRGDSVIVFLPPGYRGD